MTTSARAKVATVKLEPGTDLVGTVKFISFYPEKDNPKEPGKKFSAQWSLLGDWNGTESRVYLDTYKLTNDITKYIVEDGQWQDGSPRYKWTDTRRFVLHGYVKEKRHYVTVQPEGEKNGSPPVQQSSDPADEEPTAQAKAEADDKLVRKRWADMDYIYKRCVDMAVDAWKPVIGLDVPHDAWFPALVRSADCLFIEANKRNLPPPPKREAQA